MVHISTYEGPAAEDAKKLTDGVEAALQSEEFQKRCLDPLRKKLDNEVSNCFSYIEWQLTSDLAANLVDCAQRMAERFVEELVDGNENAAKQAFQINGYEPSHWMVVDCGFNELRRKIVEANADLLRTTYAADLEKEIAALRQEIARQATHIKTLIEERR